MMAAGLVWPQLAAMATQTQVIATYTGTVTSGTDSSGAANVFGVGTNLAGLPFTLTSTFITGVGSSSSSPCTGGSPDYYSAVTNSGGANPGVAWLSVGTGGQQFMIGGNDGETSNTSDIYQYAPICGSSNNQQTSEIAAGYGNGFGGSSYFQIAAFPVSGALVPSADWTQPITSTSISPSHTTPFSINRTITGGGTDAYAHGYLAPSSLTTINIPLNQNAETNGNPSDSSGARPAAGLTGINVRLCTIFHFDSPDPCKTNFQVGTIYIKDQTGKGGASGTGASNGPSDQLNTSSCGNSGCPHASDVTATGSAEVGEPINVATGNMYQAVTDYGTAGQNALTFTRSYNSMGSSISINGSTVTTLATTLGANWRSNYDAYLQIVTVGALNYVYAERPDGRIIPFYQSGTSWLCSSDFDMTLVQAGSSWTLTDADGTVETYTTAGSGTYANLNSITFRNGYAQTLSYSGGLLSTVTDSYGRTLTLTYSGGLLQSVDTPDSTTITYGYGTSAGSSVLTSVSYPTTPATGFTYQYGDPSNPLAITAILDGAGATYASWTYDSQGRATSSQMGGTLGANATTLAYNSNGSVTVTNALGVADTYYFVYLQGIPKVQYIKRAATATTAAAMRVFGYDSNGFLRTASDWNGNVTRYINNAMGLPTSIIGALGWSSVTRTTTITYDTTFTDLPHEIVGDGLTEDFTYDSSGNLLSETDTDTTTTGTPYSTNGQTRTTEYTWSATGQVLTAQLPRTDVTAKTTYGYDSSGALTSVTDALGNATTVTSHTGGGYPLTIVDPNGVTTTLTWDGGQRLLTSTVATALLGNLTTTITYDTAGNVASVQKPDGSTMSFAYDTAHRLTTVTDLFGNTVNYTLDALGDATQVQVEDPSMTVTASHTATFDALGRVLTYVGGMSQTTTLTWDANSNLKTVKSPLGNTTTLTYDHLNRLATSVDPSPGGTTTITYDKHDRVLSVKNPLNHTTSYVYDGFGERIQEASPDSGTAVYYFDPDGNLTKQILAGSLEADMAYDADDRMTGTTYPSDSTLNTTLTYDQTGHGDGIGRLTSATDKVGTLSLTYDERGNVTAESRVATGITTLNTYYAFDAGNNVSSITYPTGTVVAYGRDSMGRVTGVTAQPPGFGSPSNVATGITYEPFGPVTGLTYGNGITGTYSYDNDYRPTSRVDAGSATIMNLAYTYDADDNVKTITDSVNAANSQSMDYDALDRLSDATSGTGGYGAWSWTWDKDHNVTKQTIAGTATNFYLNTGTSQLQKWVTGSTTTNVTTTAAGNINLLKVGSTTTETLTYNAANEMDSATATGIATYAYDLFGRRLEKSPYGGNTILYDWAGFSTLLSENDLNSNQADYIYLGGRPIGEVNPATGAIYYTHTDLLGTPQDLTNGSQAVSWSATYRPFGDTQTVTTGLVQNLRFRGQQYDSETAYHNNGFRVYSPQITRYPMADPIGLAGGINPYQYVQGNPYKRVDLQGTFWPETIAVTLIVGGVLQSMIYDYQTLSNLPAPPQPNTLGWDDPYQPLREAFPNVCTFANPRGESPFTGTQVRAYTPIPTTERTEVPEGDVPDFPERQIEQLTGGSYPYTGWAGGGPKPID
jgi:RHS repeat-associated protein